jgi:hypothetical protein
MTTGRYLLIFLLFILISPVIAEDGNIFFREDFNGLESWKPLEFPKIKRHSRYSTERDGNESYLKAESNASASGIVFRKTFNVFDYPRVRWRWKIRNVYKKGDTESRAGDDYPARIYIMFKYDPDKVSPGERIKYSLIRAIYGTEPPYNGLNYIWANRKHYRDIIPNPYVPESKMIILQSGDENAGRWLEQEVNIIEDYRKAFGKDPPASAGLAIMNDSDDTEESSVSYIDYIEIYR